MQSITCFFSWARGLFPKEGQIGKAAETRRFSGKMCALALAPGALVWIAAVFLSGSGTLWELPRFAVVFTVCLLGCGLFFTRVFVPAAFGADQLVLAFLPGCAAVFLSHSAMARLFALWTEDAPPAAVCLLPCWLLGAGELIFRLRRFLPTRTRTAAPRGQGRVSIALPVCATLSLCLILHAIYGVFPFAEAARLKAWIYDQDMLWSVGNAAASRFGFPFQDLRAAGLTLNYHFLNDAVAGIVSRAAGCGAWHGLCYFWNGAVLALSVTGLACAGRRFAARPWTACCVAPVVFFCSTHSGALPHFLFSNANAQDTAMLALCGLLLLIDCAPAARGPRTWARGVGMGFVCFSAACMIKSTVGLLVLLGLLCAALAGAFTKQTRAWHIALLAGGACGFFTVYGLVLSRATNNLFFTGLQNLRALPSAYWQFFSLPLLLLYCAGLADSLAHFRRLSLVRLCGNAVAIGGMLAYVLFYHYSASQIYFALSAVPCAALASLPAAERIWARLTAKPKSGLFTPLKGAVALLLICFGLQLYQGRGDLRTGAQAALRCAGLRESPVQEETVTDESWQAALWLRENTRPDEVFLSNRNNGQRASGDGVFHFYTAAAERPCYVEGFRYAVDYDGQFDELCRRLEDVSDAIYYTLPPREAFALARAEGVRYIVVDRLVPGAPQWDCAPVFENEQVSIYRSDAA